MSNPNYPSQAQNDARYATPATVSSAIASQATTDSGLYNAKNTQTFNAKDFGATGNGSTDDTTALRAWASAANGRRAYLPAGTYKVSGTIVFTDTATEIFGDGVGSVISVTANTISGLVLGNPVQLGGTANTSYNADATGSAGNAHGVRVNGCVRDLYITTGSLPPAARQGSIGLQALNAIQVTFERVTVEGFDIAFDFNGNCYGAEMSNCRAPFSMSNVGVNVRTGPANGADQVFMNCWIGGKTAALYCAGGGGGIHMFGGQWSSAHTVSTQQDEGTFVFNKDYLTQSVLAGLGSMTFVGVSFEGWHMQWAIRSYGESHLVFDNCSFNQTGGSSVQAKGIWKGEAIAGSHVSFRSCGMGGAFINGTGNLAVLSGQYSGSWSLEEFGWWQTNQSATVDGGATIDIKKTSLAIQGAYTTASSLITTSDALYWNAKKLIDYNQDFTNVRSYTATGLAGATQASRFAGSTTAGAPTSGTFAVGDFIIGQAGNVWVCTVAGTPGTWSKAGAGQPYALTGATAATRYAGGTTTGAPTSGTFAVGDYVVAQNGHIWICTTAGTPGTWTDTAGTVGAHATTHEPNGSDKLYHAWQPYDSGCIQWTFDPISAGFNGKPNAGQLATMRMFVPYATTVTNILLSIVSAGATLTSGQCYAALYDGNGNLLSTTADQSTNWQSTGTKVMPLSTAQTVTMGQPLYVAYLWNGTTGPAFHTGVTSGSNVTLAGQTSNYRFGTSGTSLTAMPSTLSTPSSDARAWWAAIS